MNVFMKGKMTKVVKLTNGIYTPLKLQFHLVPHMCSLHTEKRSLYSAKQNPSLMYMLVSANNMLLGSEMY